MMAPTLLFGLWAGVLADRYDRRKLVMATNTWAALMAGVLAVLTLTRTVRMWMVFVVAFAPAWRTRSRCPRVRRS